MAARFFQGVAFAGDMATFGHFLANWTEHKRYAFLTATLALYVQLAPFFTFPAAGKKLAFIVINRIYKSVKHVLYKIHFGEKYKNAYFAVK